MVKISHTVTCMFVWLLTAPKHGQAIGATLRICLLEFFTEYG